MKEGKDAVEDWGQSWRYCGETYVPSTSILLLPPCFLILFLGSSGDETVCDIAPRAHGSHSVPKGKQSISGLRCFHIYLCFSFISA